MPSVCFYFEVHQPYRVQPLDRFEMGPTFSLFDDALNGEVLQRVARKCYLPANEAMLRLIERFRGKFRVAYGISGVALEQMQRYAPAALESFQELVQTGAVELVTETYHHTLASLYDADEFRAQIAEHQAVVEELFGQRPRVFRNTELIYDDGIGEMVADLGFDAMLAEGVSEVLDWRSPDYVYANAGGRMKLLLKNAKLSDDIAFRFSNRGWEGWPLTAEKFASWVHALPSDLETVNLFMDYETFGEHQWAESGIFEFLQHLPEALLYRDGWAFHTPSEVIDRYPARATLSFPEPRSWADAERDISAWRGNEMQERALREVHAMAEAVKGRNNPALLRLWRRLLTSDHFYYMSTKWFADGDVHAYFSPFESPYEAFVSYMNVLSQFEARLLGDGPEPPPATAHEAGRRFDPAVGFNVHDGRHRSAPAYRAKRPGVGVVS